MIELIPVQLNTPCCTLDISGDDQTRLIAIMKAAGNAVRFEILKFLVTHPGCITGDIVDFLPIAQSTVSEHLRVLRDAGWIQGTVSGPAMCYCINPETSVWFKEKVGNIF